MWQMAIPLAMSAFSALKKSGGGSSNYMSQLNKASYEDRKIQNFLPEPLRFQNTYPMLRSGIAGIGELMSNPGGMSPNIASAIAPRLGMESQGIAQNFRGMQANQAGGAARSNLPVSIKAALASALDTQQERAQRDARMGLMAESEQLRRGDLDQVYKLLDAMLGFTNAGRGISNQGLSSAANSEANNQASLMSLFGSIANSMANYKKA